MNTRFLSSLLGIAAISLLGLSSLNAGVITTNPLAPTDDILLGSAGIAPSGNFGYSNADTGNQFGGIAFTLGSSIELEKVTFYLNTVSSGMPNADIQVSVVQFSTLPTSGGPTETPLYAYTTLHSETMVFPDSRPAGEYVTFSFTDAQSLSAGTYGILLEIDGPSAGRSITLRNVSDNLANVVSFRTVETANPTTYQVASQESYFALQGIPEPSVVFLAGSGLLLAGVLRRRR